MNMNKKPKYVQKIWIIQPRTVPGTNALVLQSLADTPSLQNMKLWSLNEPITSMQTGWTITKIVESIKRYTDQNVDQCVIPGLFRLFFVDHHANCTMLDMRVAMIATWIPWKNS